jgi:hypothetical protein
VLWLYIALQCLIVGIAVSGVNGLRPRADLGNEVLWLTLVAGGLARQKFAWLILSAYSVLAAIITMAWASGHIFQAGPPFLAVLTALQAALLARPFFGTRAGLRPNGRRKL